MQTQRRILILTMVVVVAALTRLIPHPVNVAPLGAMALFGSAYFGRKGLGLLITMCAWLFSDLLLNNLVYPAQGLVLFTEGAVYIYGSILLIYMLGSQLFRKMSVGRMLAGSLSASVIFFLLSNFGVWATGLYYPVSFEGLLACYTAALPFFQNTLLGDLAYATALFVIYERYLKSQLLSVTSKKD